jgi:Lon protease-like protein
MADELVEIPLFPLGLVLFPGMAQPLHIFEPRYREMTKHCLDSAGNFGITLALPESVFQHEVPARIGSIARILDYNRLPNGRYNLLTVGARRFEIVETMRDQPYLRGLVRLLPEELGTGPVAKLATEARSLLDEYLAIVLADSEDGEKDIAIPDDPIELSYFIAVLLPCEDSAKQELLEAPAADIRLARELDFLRYEITHARAAHSPSAPGADDHPPSNPSRRS